MMSRLKLMNRVYSFFKRKVLVFLFALFFPNSRTWRKGLELIRNANPRDDIAVYILPSVDSSSDQKLRVDVIGVVLGKEY